MSDNVITVAIPPIFRHPERWQFIGTAFPSDLPAIEHPRHRHWMMSNSHRHAHREILFVLDGNGCHGLDGRIYPITAGTVMIFDAFEDHDLNAPEWAVDHDHLWIMFVHDQCIVRRRIQRHGITTWPDSWTFFLSQQMTGLRTNACLDGIDAQSVLPEEFRRLRVQSVIGQLITAVAQSLLSDAGEESRESFQERIISTAKKYIKSTAGKGVTLDHLARISGYSKFHFTRLFKQYTGHSVHDYINLCRTERVHELLSNGYSKTAIAGELGFSCQSAFSRWHAKWMMQE